MSSSPRIDSHHSLCIPTAQAGSLLPDPCLVTYILLKESKRKILWILVTLEVTIRRCPGSNSLIWCLASQEGTVNLVHSNVLSAFRGCDQLFGSCNLQAPFLKCAGWHCRFGHSQWDPWRTILRWWWRSSVSKPEVWEVVETAWEEEGSQVRGGGLGRKAPTQTIKIKFSKTQDQKFRLSRLRVVWQSPAYDSNLHRKAWLWTVPPCCSHVAAGTTD